MFFCEKRSVFPTVVNSDSLDTFLSLTPTHSVFQRACSSASTLSFFFFSSSFLGSCCDSWMLLLGSAPSLPTESGVGPQRRNWGFKFGLFKRRQRWLESPYRWPRSAAWRRGRGWMTGDFKQVFAATADVIKSHDSKKTWLLKFNLHPKTSEFKSPNFGFFRTFS